MDISYQEGQRITTPITQEESNALNKLIQLNKGMELNIIGGTLIDASGKKYDYSYKINADGKTGTRTSLKGTYNMILIPNEIPKSPSVSAQGPSTTAYPPQPQRASTSTPPASAYGAPLQPKPTYADKKKFIEDMWNILQSKLSMSEVNVNFFKQDCNIVYKDRFKMDMPDEIFNEIIKNERKININGEMVIRR